MLKHFFKISLLLGLLPKIAIAQTIAKDVIDRYFRVIGGLDLIEQVDCFYAVSETNLNGNTITIHNKQQIPNLKSIVVYKNGNFISKKVFNGDTGYQITNKNIKTSYTKSQILANTNRSAIFPEFSYLKKAIYIGVEKVLGSDCHVLKLGEKRIFYNISSGLKIKTTNFKQIKNQKKIQETYYLNYKVVKGIKFPVIYKTVMDGREMTYHVKSISLNRDVNRKDFE